MTHTQDRTTPSPLHFTPAPKGTLGGTLSGFKIQELDDDAIDALWQLVYREKILTLVDQDFDERDYVAFAARLGTIRPYFQEHYRHPDHPEIFVSTNMPHGGRKVGVSGTGRMWHADYSFFPDPISLTMITPRVLPDAARETHFIDMARVARELPPHLRRALADHRCFHEATNYYKVQPQDVDRAIIELVEEFRSYAPRSWHPAFVTHPVTGEEILYANSGFTTKVEGVTTDESTALLAELFAFVERDAHIHRKPHLERSILLWDNRALIHQAHAHMGGGENCNYRISLNDGLPFCGAPPTQPT